MSSFQTKLLFMREHARNSEDEGLVTMSKQELSRLELMHRLGDKRLKQSEAAAQLGLSVRQVRRLHKAFLAGGASALVSGRRGKPSNNRLGPVLRAEVHGLLASRYIGFGPTLAHEKLTEEHGLRLSVESLRQLMIEEGLWRARRARKVVVHQMRERRAALGELVQIDGSPHAWLEKRGPSFTLLVFIDDATGLVQYLQFVPTESTWTYFDAARSYIQQHGKPCAFYSDQLGVFKVNAKEVLNGRALTQFGRAMEELDIDLICAHSPQAKGRVERMNQTLQDRLVKEMRLENICDLALANVFLPVFAGKLNARFAVTPRSAHDAHRPLRSGENLTQILAMQTSRVLSKNLTLQYDNAVYQIQTTRPGYAMRNAQVIVLAKEREGAITISYQGLTDLNYSIHHVQTKTKRPWSRLNPSTPRSITARSAKVVHTKPQSRPSVEKVSHHPQSHLAQCASKHLGAPSGDGSMKRNVTLHRPENLILHKSGTSLLGRKEDICISGLTDMWEKRTRVAT